MRFLRRFFNKVTIGAIFFIFVSVVLVFTSLQNNHLAEKSSDDAVHSISKFYLKELGERRSLTISNRLKEAEQDIGRISHIVVPAAVSQDMGDEAQPGQRRQQGSPVGHEQPLGARSAGHDSQQQYDEGKEDKSQRYRRVKCDFQIVFLHIFSRSQ